MDETEFVLFYETHKDHNSFVTIDSYGRFFIIEIGNSTYEGYQPWEPPQEKGEDEGCWSEWNLDLYHPYVLLDLGVKDWKIGRLLNPKSILRFTLSESVIRRAFDQKKRRLELEKNVSIT